MTASRPTVKWIMVLRCPSVLQQDCLFAETGTRAVSTTSQSSAPQALITGVWNEAPLKWMTFIKVVLRDRCFCWWGWTCTKKGGGDHLTRRASAWINSSAGFSFFRRLWAKPHCDRRRDYNHLAVRPARPPTLNILIMDEIHLYVAIIVPNCFFEGDRGRQHLADIWLDAWERERLRARQETVGAIGSLSTI